MISKRSFGNKINKIPSNKMMCGTATLYKDNRTGTYVKISVGKMMLKDPIQNKYIDPIKHLFCGITISDEGDVLATFASSKKMTAFFNNMAKIANIKALHPGIGYLNPLWHIKYSELTEYVNIDPKFDSIPQSFKNISNKNKYDLACIIQNEFKNVWAQSLLNNLDPISLDFKANDLNLSYTILKSHVMVASHCGLLNKYHSKIFIEKTRISYDQYSIINTNLLNGNKGVYIDDITNFLK